MIIIRLALSVVLLSAVAVANGNYEPIDTTDFANRAGINQGRLVAVTGVVCGINANGKSIQLFDPETKALIEVTVTQLKKAERRTLIMGPVKSVTVYGRTESKNGRLSIDAHQVFPHVLSVTSEESANGSKTSER